MICVFLRFLLFLAGFFVSFVRPSQKHFEPPPTGGCIGLFSSLEKVVVAAAATVVGSSGGLSLAIFGLPSAIFSFFQKLYKSEGAAST